MGEMIEVPLAHHISEKIAGKVGAADVRAYIPEEKIMVPRAGAVMLINMGRAKADPNVREQVDAILSPKPPAPPAPAAPVEQQPDPSAHANVGQRPAEHAPQAATQAVQTAAPASPAPAPAVTPAPPAATAAPTPAAPAHTAAAATMPPTAAAALIPPRA
jgi:hypothetical protein